MPTTRLTSTLVLIPVFLSVPLRQLPALGQCLATLAGAMPVAFLEPLLNTYNPCSIFNTKSARERASESYVITEIKEFIIKVINLTAICVDVGLLQLLVPSEFFEI